MPSDAASQIEGILAAKLACNLSVRVKNTFIEVWDGGSEDKAAAPQRAFCTCPELSGVYEPESELSPGQVPRGAPAGAAAAPEDQGLLLHLLGGSAAAARAASKGSSQAEPAPERSPRWADLMEEAATPTAASAADRAVDGPERLRPQDAFSALLEWEPVAPAAASPPAEPERLPAEEAAAAAGRAAGRGAESSAGRASGSEGCGAGPRASQDAEQPQPRKARGRRQRQRQQAAARAQAEGGASYAAAAPSAPEEAAAPSGTAAEEAAPEPAAPSDAEAPGAAEEAAPEPAAPSYAEVALRGRSCRQPQQQAAAQEQADREPPFAGPSPCAAAAADLLRLLRCEHVPEPSALAEADAVPEGEGRKSRRERRRQYALGQAEGETSCAGAPASEPAAPACADVAREGSPASADVAHEGAHGRGRQRRRADAPGPAGADFESSRAVAASWVAKAFASEPAAPAFADVAREGASACADDAREGAHGGRRQWRQAAAHRAEAEAEAESSSAVAVSWAAEAAAEVAREGARGGRRQRRQAATHRAEAEAESERSRAGAAPWVAKAAAGAAAPADAGAAGGDSRAVRRSKDLSEDSRAQPVQACRGGRNNHHKLWCHLYLSEEMLRSGFDLNKKVIGHGGSCTKGIFDVTGAKVRLRGRGSGHLEGHRWLEAPVHLMLAVTVEKGEAENFRTAVRMAAEHLRDIEGRFHGFCRQRGLPAPRRNCFWVGEISANGTACLGSILEDIPQDADSTKGASEDQ